jgi:hypothetical protein
MRMSGPIFAVNCQIGCSTKAIVPAWRSGRRDQYRGAQRACRRACCIGHESEAERTIPSFEQEGEGWCGKASIKITRSSFSSWNPKIVRTTKGLVEALADLLLEGLGTNEATSMNKEGVDERQDHV